MVPCRALICCALLIASIAGLRPGGASAQQTESAIPSPEEFLGYPLGARFTDYHGIREYSQALAESPLARYLPYGRSVEGRELFQLVIARPDVQARLDQVLAANGELARAGTSAARARQIAATNPAVIYFSYGVHGNESSSSEAALWTAYDLVSGAPGVAGVLDSLIVVIDPVTNPDGRARYVQWYRSVRGANPNPDPRTREHQEPWPGGRYNHYLFDLNRDWSWMTQPETQARIATWWRWNPEVHVDFHEMGPNSSYFFFPATAPINPIYPAHVLEWGERFGLANASAFDAQGWSYFTAESYDLLYPGYGDSWPSLQGAIGMTYEQAGGGPAGLAYARSDGDTLTLALRAMHHRAAGSATLRAAASGKTRLLLDFADANRTAGQGHPDFLLVPGSDPGRLDRLVAHLLAQGIEVERSTAAFQATAEAYPGYQDRGVFPAGTARVRARQPRGRLAVTLLQPETRLLAEFSYDISAWSLAYAYGVEAYQTAEAPAAGWRSATAAAPIASSAPPASYGYLVAANDESAAGVIRYLVADGSVRVLTRPSVFGGREWSAGTWFLPIAGDEAARGRVDAAGLGGFAVPVSTGLSERGIDLGSANAPAVRLPEVALVGGEGVVAASYGAHWYHLEKELGLPFAPIALDDLTELDLDDFDVIVLPDMRGMLADETSEVLADWIADGGRLVAVAGGAEAAAPLANIELREMNDEADSDSAALDRLLATREEREREAWTEEVPGAILQVHLDAGHPLAWGTSFDGSPDRLFILHAGDRVFEPTEGAEAIAFFAPGLVAVSGMISDANLRHLEQGGWLVSRRVRAGEVILFADDPLFRLFWRTTMPLYRNALLLGAL